MKRTIFSSFFFLLPINIAFKRNDIFALNMSVISLALSIANHSHTFHSDQNRRQFFKNLDLFYMNMQALYLICFKFNLITTFIGFLIFSYYKLFLGENDIEYYTPTQKNYHVLFHAFAINSVTLCYFYS
jgi:hypothetical protein